MTAFSKSRARGRIYIRFLVDLRLVFSKEITFKQRVTDCTVHYIGFCSFSFYSRNRNFPLQTFVDSGDKHVDDRFHILNFLLNFHEVIRFDILYDSHLLFKAGGGGRGGGGG